MQRAAVGALILILGLLRAESALAWNATGHRIVAGIAWDHMTPTARRNAIALLRAAPPDACLLNLFPADARPLEQREREFFMQASTWADIVRPENDGDKRPCTRFSRGEWHFINTFWEGISGEMGTDRPRDRTDLRTPEINVVERLGMLRPFTACASPACGTTPAERATMLAWILHLVGDLHQPLHTAARVTMRPDERDGDQGGGRFMIRVAAGPRSLHIYWDGIVNLAVPQQANERDLSYANRVLAAVVMRHPRSQFAAGALQPNAARWSREGLETTKQHVYPRTLLRDQIPSMAYRDRALAIAQEAMARGGYRLAEMLNQMFAI